MIRRSIPALASIPLAAFGSLPRAAFACLALALVLLAPPAHAQEADPPVPIDAPGTVVESVPKGAVTESQIQRQAASLFGGYGGPIVENSVERYLIRFVTTGVDGSPTIATAQLFLPVLDQGREPVAIYAFGSGTTGVGEACAPSREPEYGKPLGNYAEYMQAYAGRGFVAVIPDYLGFHDDKRPQAYFHAEAEGRVMLDAIRATYDFLAREVPNLQAPGDVFTAGYSQGGHAAFAAADLRPLYAPEVPLRGMIGYAPTTNVERLLREGPYYAPYIAVSYASIYGTEVFDPAKVLDARWLPSLADDTERLCVDRAQSYYPFDGKLIYDSAFATALYSRRLAEEYPSIAQVLQVNRTGLSAHGLPALIVQGSQDVIVTDATQEIFLRELCEMGSAVQYNVYPEARHRHTRPAGFEDSIAWMKGIVAGNSAPTTCTLVLTGQLD